jgi:hypothetical protein
MNFFEMILKPVSDAYSRRQDRRAVEHTNNIELLKAQGERSAALVREGLAADATWELESLKAHSAGWKDEFVLIVLSAPFLAGFFPMAQPYIEKGWEMLQKAPSWYPWILVLIFGAIYGLRLWRRNQYDTE